MELLGSCYSNSSNAVMLNSNVTNVIMNREIRWISIDMITVCFLNCVLNVPNVFNKTKHEYCSQAANCPRVCTTSIPTEWPPINGAWMSMQTLGNYTCIVSKIYIINQIRSTQWQYINWDTEYHGLEHRTNPTYIY